MTLDALGANALPTSRTGEVAVGASQTLAPPTEAEWKYVSVRRTFIFLDHSIDEGTQWAVFEPNAEPLWSKLRHSIGAFLETQWRSGAFQGADAAEAYFVRCDRTTMTQADVDAGTVNVVVGFAAEAGRVRGPADRTEGRARRPGPVTPAARTLRR